MTADFRDVRLGFEDHELAHGVVDHHRRDDVREERVGGLHAEVGNQEAHQTGRRRLLEG